MLREILKNWTKGEWLSLAIISLILIILTWWPYYYLSQHVPRGFVYNASTFINPGDNTVYYSYIRQGIEDGWLVKNFYTSESTLAVLHPFWTGLGKIAKIFSLIPQTIFHLARTVLIPIFIFFVYWLISYFLREKKDRLISLLIFSLGAGLGWLYVLAKPFFWFDNAWHNVPFDVFIPDAFPFTSMVISPHFILSWLLLLITLVFGFLALRHNNYVYTLTAAIVGAILILLHPFHAPTILFVLGAYWLFMTYQKKTFFWSGTWQLALIFLATLPSIGYYFYLYQADWVTSIKTNQNFLPSPKPFITFLSFGTAVILAILSFFWSKRKNHYLPNFNFLVIWALLNTILIYLPFLWQRRLAEGWWFPLAIMVGFFIAQLDNLAKNQIKDWSIKRWFVWLPLALILFISNLNFLGLNYFYIKYQSNYFFYYPQEFKQIAAWLEKNTRADEIIFTNYDLFFRTAPALISRRQYIGHLVETVYVHSKYMEMKWFFQNNLHDEKKQEFLQQTGINYIIFYEQTPEMNIFQPQTKEYLQPVFISGDYVIYQVNLAYDKR